MTDMPVLLNRKPEVLNPKPRATFGLVTITYGSAGSDFKKGHCVPYVRLRAIRP